MSHSEVLNYPTSEDLFKNIKHTFTNINDLSLITIIILVNYQLAAAIGVNF